MPKPLAFILQLMLLCSFSIMTFSQSVVKKTFAFNLSQSSNTSAGVYKKDGTLVRTLWSGVTYAAGRQVQQWDGLDDDGKPVADTEVHIKVLSNNVKYEWEGAQIGNTSTAFTGATKLRLFEPVKGVAIAGNTAYFAGGYNEGWPAQFKVSLSNPNAKTWIGRMKSTDQASDYVATDGINVYWGGYDPLESKSQPETFVFATSVVTDRQVPFIKGVPAQMLWGGIYPSTIAYQKAAKSIISGMAVQKSGLFLFVARSEQNQLQVLNKVTGEVIQTLNFSDAKKCIVDINDNLWLVHSKKVEKFKVNSNGTLSSLGINVSVSNAVALAVSPDNNVLLVSDMTSQQVKAFNANTGVALWIMGEQGGYLTNAAVNDYKFYWKDVRNEEITFLTYLSDGSFYVGDVGNFRVQHYNKDQIFMDRVMFLKNVYNTSVDKKNPKRIFSDFLEFEVDYNQPMGANNNSWKLVRNWGGNFGGQYDQFNKIFNIVTFSNGRTYALNRIEDKYFLMELAIGGVLRYTGIEFPQRTLMEEDGSKSYTPGTRLGHPCYLMKYPLLGFDKKNNPIWSAKAETIAQTPPMTAYDPAPWEGFRGDIITPSGNAIFFDYTRADNGHSLGFHLGAIKKGSDKWLWKAAPSTSLSYLGPFPPDGAFDNGNGVVAHGAGGTLLIKDNNLFWGYHGEFWKQSQTNMWNHVDANTGLFVGQFGALTSDYPDIEAFPGGAGNVLSGTVVEVNGILYLYHNDESVHAGVHRWKITGLNTIDTRTAAFTNDAVITEGIDLLEGLQRGIVLGNQNGWYRGTEPNENAVNKWDIQTGVKTYNPFKSPDVNIEVSLKADQRILKRDLGNNIGLTSWKLIGKMNFERSAPTEASFNRTGFIEVLDKNDRIISRFDFRQDFVSGQNVIFNDKIIFKGGDIELDKIKSRNQPLEISAINGIVSCSYAGMDAVATDRLIDPNSNWQDPKWLRFYFNNKPGSDDYIRYFNVSEMRFVAKRNDTPTPAPVPVAPVTQCSGTGLITWEYWKNVPFRSISNIPLTIPAAEKRLQQSFSAPQNIGDYFGARMRGYICAPASGNYIFYISGDDKGELWLSNGSDPNAKKKIAFFDEWTGYLQNGKYPSQKSQPIYLQVGQKYYVEALYLESHSGDHCNVSWVLPDGKSEAPIAGKWLMPFDNNQVNPPTPPVVTPPNAPVKVPNALPVVSITSPVTNAGFVIPNSIIIAANASDADGTITKVEFYAGSDKIGEDNTVPYTIEWTPALPGNYNLTLKATDNEGATQISQGVNIVISPKPVGAAPSCSSAGSIIWEYWSKVPFGNIENIPVAQPPTLTRSLTSFSTPVDFADYFGARVRGFICPPQTGYYTFYVSGDDMGELWLSENDDPAKKVRIANFNDWTGLRENNKYSSQKSKSIYLKEGQKYYVEALHLEAHSGDNISVSWLLPNGIVQAPIPGNRLVPFIVSESVQVQLPALNIAPNVSISDPTANTSIIVNVPLTITANATDVDGSIAKVEFYVGGAKIGENQASPYSFVWLPTQAGNYSISVKATDNQGAQKTSEKVNIEITEPVTQTCTGKGNLTWEYWAKIKGSSISAIPTNKTPDEVRNIDKFDTPIDVKDFYGARVRGYFCPPITGNYTFYLAGDDMGELWLSNSENPSAKKRIAFFNSWTSYKEFNKFSTQKTTPVFLNAGQKYYIEALHLETHGSDHLTVAMLLPNNTFQNPIQGSNLIPFEQIQFKTAGRPVNKQEEKNSEKPDPLSVVELVLKTYPNPFSTALNIECNMPQAATGKLQLYNIQGVLLKTLVNGHIPAGRSKYLLSAAGLPNGQYILKLITGKQIVNKQLILIK